MLRLTAQRSLRSLTPATRALPSLARAAPSLLLSRPTAPSAARALSVSAPRAVPSTSSLPARNETHPESR